MNSSANKSHTYTVTLPDGTKRTRTTKRVYTHAIVCFNHASDFFDTWCGSLALAERQSRGCSPELYKIIPVDNPRS